jgi:pSer/pThr/pTyr-binding forkhead associated (FHA) protein
MTNDKTEIMGDPPDATALQDLEQQCPNCDAEMRDGEQFCPKCGYQRGSWQGGADIAEAGEVRTAVYELRSSSGCAWPVYEGVNEIGRGEVQIQLDNPYASRSHAQLSVAADGSLTIEDLGSSNGTLIAGEAIAANTPQPLDPGIEFKIGEDTFTLHKTESAEEAGEPESSDEPAEEAGSEPVDEAESDVQPETGAEADASDADAEANVVMSPWSVTIADGEPQQLPLGETVMGRKASNGGIVIAGDGYVSGTHCKVSAGMDSLSVEDLGSTNGTRIGEQQLVPGEPAELSAGDVFIVGQTPVTVGSSDAAAGQADADDTEDEPGEPEPKAEPESAD